LLPNTHQCQRPTAHQYEQFGLEGTPWLIPSIPTYVGLKSHYFDHFKIFFGSNEHHPFSTKTLSFNAIANSIRQFIQIINYFVNL
jgi:hypothetical protein